jgi:hypothetical protein
MTHDTEYQAPNSDLRAVYAAAIDTAGREAANAVCIQHGATAGLHPWRRVPDNKAKACLAALEKLAGGKSKTTPTPRPAAARSFEQVRREAFARIGTTEREAPTPPKRLDANAIYERWNNPPEKTED